MSSETERSALKPAGLEPASIWTGISLLSQSSGLQTHTGNKSSDFLSIQSANSRFSSWDLPASITYEPIP